MVNNAKKLRPSVFIIAEIGVNHDGNLSKAKKLICAAKKSGADAVKFQSFITDEFVKISSTLASYQKTNTKNRFKSQYQLLKKLELDFNKQAQLKKYALSQKIQFISSAFDPISLQFLIKNLNLKLIKLGSGEITNLPLIYAVGFARKKLILSTGMATLAEVKDALVAYYLGINNIKPSLKLSKIKYDEVKFKNWLRKDAKANLTLLHCVSEYPTEIKKINLNSISVLRNHFPVSIGLSDHTESLLVPALSVALGATVIEKHLTLDRSSFGPDHRASLTPKEFKLMVKNIRSAELAIGRNLKIPTKNELVIAQKVRKGIYASKKIRKGSIISVNDLSIKRPANGIHPKYYWKLIGMKANKSYEINESINELNLI